MLQWLNYIHGVSKKMEPLVFLSITFTKFNKSSQFLAQFISTFKVTEKLSNVPSQSKLTSSRWLRYRGVPRKRNAKVHLAATVASKFARFKSGWLQRVEDTAREGVQNTHHWSWRPQTSHQNQNRVGQAGSRRHCCSCALVALLSFSWCQGGQRSFRALL